MTHKSFLGLPVEGDIFESPRVEQRPVEELAPIIQAALDDPNIVEFGWEQFTPYFNDGDPCVFSVYEAWFRTEADRGLDDSELRVWGDYHPTIKPGHPSYHVCRTLDSEVTAGHFHDVLLAAFGDHASVKFTRDGITVEYCEHF